MRAFVLVAVLLLTASKCPAEEQHHKQTPAATCHEDEPCWDCKTMGNKTCGPAPRPTSKPGPPIKRLAAARQAAGR